ncbi:hypothetical protein PPROV_000440400 [Pycnococcus provasolii]|uniref:Flavin-containing monooxygenase n=1 Tax=Pycnococcus provasolii TaxID=41880 RepID=A0A830HF19_9CHLO|nr:hypothetical protein PPROV_000440400 [Pycnococcus provasolii]|mmetsp:Transcript_8565/g.19511  ORF Transcript_8565/g.19511 Transcript_8565/m.19511 type:complete len:597 (-) Transcript_8565:238-2028(-)
MAAAYACAPASCNTSTQSDDDTSSKTVGIVGAGPAGLVFAKELLEQGMDVVLFEMQKNVGGVFSRTYDGTMLTTSNVLTQFSSHQTGEEKEPLMYTAEQYVGYLESFAKRFGVLSRIHFSTRVERIAPKSEETGKYEFTVRNVSPRLETTGDHDGGINNDALMRAEWDLVPCSDEMRFYFDHVVVCSGVNLQPVMARWPDMDKFRGEILHTMGYKNAEPYKGKRVLLVGLGESGSDIALQVAKVASQSAISSRSGPGTVTPRYLDQEPADLITNRAYYCMPDEGTETLWRNIFWWSYQNRKALKDHATNGKWALDNYKRNALPTNRFGTKNTSFMVAQAEHGTAIHPDIDHFTETGVQFVDGTTFDCDAVIVNTGYKGDLKFLSSSTGGAVDDDTLADFGDVRLLFKHMYHPNLGSDIVLGGFARPAFGAIPPCAEMQARYHALVLAGKKELPADMDDRIRRDRDFEMKRYPKDSPRLSALTDYLFYMESMADLIGCSPKGEFLRKLNKSHPNIHKRVMFGPISAHAYRLRGEHGADFAAMEKYYGDLPFSRFFSKGPGAMFIKVHAMLLNIMQGLGYNLRGVSGEVHNRRGNTCA